MLNIFGKRTVSDTTSPQGEAAADPKLAQREAILVRLRALFEQGALADDVLSKRCEDLFGPIAAEQIPPVSLEMTPCHNCQNSVPAAATYCPDCGFALQGAGVPAQLAPAPLSDADTLLNSEKVEAEPADPVPSVTSFGQFTPAERLKRALAMDKRVRPVRFYPAEGMLAEEQLAAPRSAKIFSPHNTNRLGMRVPIVARSTERIITIQSPAVGSYTSTHEGSKPPLEFF